MAKNKKSNKASASHAKAKANDNAKVKVQVLLPQGDTGVEAVMREVSVNGSPCAVYLKGKQLGLTPAEVGPSHVVLVDPDTESIDIMANDQAVVDVQVTDLDEDDHRGPASDLLRITFSKSPPTEPHGIHFGEARN